MNKLLTIFLVLSLVFGLSGCGSDEVNVDEIKNMTVEDATKALADKASDAVCPDTKAECPSWRDSKEYQDLKEDRAECEEDHDDCKDDYNDYKKKYKYKTCDSCCQRCPTQSDCKDFGTTPVELGLFGIELFNQEKPELEDHLLTIDYDNTSYQKLQSAKLSFEPRCDSTNAKTVIKVNGATLLNSDIGCKNVKTVSIPKANLVIGRNNITYQSDVENTYRVEDVEINTTYNDSTALKTFDYIVLEKREYEETKFSDLEDTDIKNYIEYDFTLDSEEIKNDMKLAFNTDLRKGNLYVHVNSKKVFNGAVNASNNELVIPKSYLKEGKNTIKFLGING